MGWCFLGSGCRICVGKEGFLQFGDNVRNNVGMTLICEDKVVIGDNVHLVGIH